MESEQVQEPNIPAKKGGNRVKRLLLWFIGVTAFVIVIPIALVFIYEKEIKTQIVNELNKRLNVKVYVAPNDIDFTIVRTFPKAAIWFKNVTVMGSLPDVANDTLLKAESIFLLFNTKDIWNKKYVINQIEIKKASLKIIVNDLGETNYSLLKEAEVADKTGNSTDFKLNKIVLTDFDFAYKNFQKKIKCAANFNAITFSGNFSDKEYALNVNAKGFVSYIKSNKKSYLKNKDVSIDVVALINRNTYTINKADVAINKLYFSGNGSITNADTALPANINFKGKNIDVQSVLSLLPQKFHDKIKDYESKGIFYADVFVAGNLYDYNSLDIKSAFGIEKASVTYTPLKTTLNDVNFKGSFTKQKYKTEMLTLKNISAHQNKNFISGDMELKNFASPRLTFNANGKYNLHDLLTLVPIDTLASAEGFVDFELNAALNLSELSSKKNEAGTLLGKINLSEVKLSFKNGKLIEVPEGLIAIDNESVSTQNLKIIHQTSSLSVTGSTTNLLNYLFKQNQTLQINAEIKSPLINVNDFLYKEVQATSGKELKQSKQVVSLNSNITAQVKLNVTKIQFNKFTAQNLVGTLELRNKKLLAKNFSFEAFDGDITLNSVADASDSNKISITGNTKLVDVNINKMFAQLNNFGQTAIEDKNLRGKATAQIDFSADWNRLLECNLSSVLVSADLNIDRGELISFSPLESLSKYVELKELEDIKFSNLQTHVDIKNRTISISKTQINNSALNMDISGTHTFNNEIDYHFKLLLGEVLAKRPNKSKQLDEELIENQNDPELKRCVFIHMTGTVDKPIIKYDRKAFKEKIKQDIKDEKKNLKRLLNEEFGLFKKDTSITNKKTEKIKSNQTFEIQFNDSKKPDKIKPGKKNDDEDF